MPTLRRSFPRSMEDPRVLGLHPCFPDTEEVPTGFPDGGEEVDRPADAFGASLSGDFDFGP